MKRNKPKIGQEIELMFSKKLPKLRPTSTYENGMICLINKNHTGIVLDWSTWLCRVDYVKPTCVIVTPLYATVSPAVNRKEYQEKLKKLKESQKL